MTLATIMKLAMRQLDEPDVDLGEHEELFRHYANMGYRIALKQYFQPRLKMELESDWMGDVMLGDERIGRIVEVRDKMGRCMPFVMNTDGQTLHVGAACQKVMVLCEYDYPLMKDGLDSPMMPEYAQPALADYICYRHLSSGSLAKQSRAEFFRNSFYEQMRAMRPQADGSVKEMKNLYAATR